jgi:nucleotide-binding universal stress UspA family protein
MRPRRILVPLDGSRQAEAALDAAVQFARDGAVLVLLRAVEAPTQLGADPTEAQARAVREAEGYLEAAAARARGFGAGEVETSVWYGPPVEAIAEAAKFREADLIVMSTHGRSGLARLLLGSVAESVLRSATLPVLLLRSGQPGTDKAPASRVLTARGHEQ